MTDYRAILDAAKSTADDAGSKTMVRGENTYTFHKYENARGGVRWAFSFRKQRPDSR